MDLHCRVPNPEKRFLFDGVGGAEAVQAGPAVGVDKRPESSRAVGPVGVHGRKGGRPEDAGGRLGLPEELVDDGEHTVIKVLDLDQVQPALGATLVGIDGPDGGEAVPHADGLADFWDGRRNCHSNHLRIRRYYMSGDNVQTTYPQQTTTTTC